MGSHGGGGTSIYIKYPDRSEDICRGVFRDFTSDSMSFVMVLVCEWLYHACSV
jgi:hypothetical protein